jgi:hypothetical protein
VGAAGDGGSFEAQWFLPAWETVWVGFLAYHVDASQGEILIQSDAGMLRPYETRSGLDVAYVDLVDEAKGRGIGVDFLGQRMTGPAGTCTSTGGRAAPASST